MRRRILSREFPPVKTALEFIQMDDSSQLKSKAIQWNSDQLPVPEVPTNIDK